MNLADKIIARRDRDENQRLVSGDYTAGDIDDCGIPVPSEVTYDYLCARTLKEHPRLYKRNGNIFEIGKTNPVMMRKENAIWFCGMNHELLKNGGHMIYWRRLLQLLPELSNDKIKITDRLCWNIAEGRMEQKEEG